jgi:hypothetical protein
MNLICKDFPGANKSLVAYRGRDRKMVTKWPFFALIQVSEIG